MVWVSGAWLGLVWCFSVGLVQKRHHCGIPEGLLEALSPTAERQGDAPVATGFCELPVIVFVAHLQTAGAKALVCRCSSSSVVGAGGAGMMARMAVAERGW